MTGRHWLRWPLLLLFSVLLLAGCVTVPKLLVGIVPDKELETLQSAISISVKAGEKSMGSRGYLVFSKPDRFHLVFLTPFGATFLEAFVNGEKVVALLADKGVAYSGVIADLPEREGMHSWGLLQWSLERMAIAGPLTRVREKVMVDGSVEKVYLDSNGQIQRKLKENGDAVEYDDYRTVAGVAFPHEIVIRNRQDDTVKIVFDEPEINKPVPEADFIPRLGNLVILPLAQFRGF